MIYDVRSYARAGLLGNPSDGYFGRTISISVKNFGAHISLMEALSEAGGHIPSTAVLDDVKLIRGPLRDPSIYSVNVKSILAAKTRDIQLQRYDIVYVPPTRLASASRIMSLILPFLDFFSTAATYGLNERIHF